MTDSATPADSRRLSTGDPGLDSVLHGGLLPGCCYILQGPPGSGKTVLANQLCFHHARQGRRALYVTLLAEAHNRLLGFLSDMAFYDEGLVGSELLPVSAFDVLQDRGLEGVRRLITEEARRMDAAVVVLDGLFILGASSHSETEFRRFINELATLAGMTGQTFLLLTNASRGRGSPEYTMVDGWIELDARESAYRAYRDLRVHKLRGSGYLPGRHAATISTAGLKVLPRLEEAVAGQASGRRDQGRSSTGVAGLDAMLGGGIPGTSSSLILGPSGSGKTALGLHFISQCSPEQPGLIFGFYETPEQLMDKADGLGLPLRQQVAAGAVEILWQSPADALLDDIGYRIIETVGERGARRLLVDSLTAVEQAVVDRERLPRFLAALGNVLFEQGVASVFTKELPQLLAAETVAGTEGLAAIAENILLLRYRERAEQLHRTLSIVKVRGSQYDPHVRELSVGPQGITLGEPEASPR